MLEQWQTEIINDKIERVRRGMFSLEVDLRVSRRIGDKGAEAQVIELIKTGEAQLAALEEELNG